MENAYDAEDPGYEETVNVSIAKELDSMEAQLHTFKTKLETNVNVILSCLMQTWAQPLVTDSLKKKTDSTEE